MGIMYFRIREEVCDKITEELGEVVVWFVVPSRLFGSEADAGFSSSLDSEEVWLMRVLVLVPKVATHKSSLPSYHMGPLFPSSRPNLLIYRSSYLTSLSSLVV